MNLTAAARQRFVEELIAFETAALEIRNRFYAFLVTHDPKDYADYSIYPFSNSTAPLWRGYFNLVPYLADVTVDELAAEPSNGLQFQGPLSVQEIEFSKQAAGNMDDFYDNEQPHPAHPDADEDVRKLPASFAPSIIETQNEWNEKALYINIPDAYLDDPDAWEANVLASMAKDKEQAQKNLEMFLQGE